MTSTTAFARTLRALLIPVAVLAAGMGAAFAEELALPLSQNKAARIVQARVLAGQTQVTVAAPELVDDHGNLAAAPRSILVALPAGARNFSVEVLSPAGARATTPDGLMRLRGQPVLRILVRDAGDQDAVLNIRHDGRWQDATGSRLASASVKATIAPTLPLQRQGMAGQGSYLMVVAPQYQAAIEPLVEWKTRKGLLVRTVSTSETGASASGIKNYIQNAYDTWENPPEYVLLVGDVDDIPTYSFYGNPSDQPYVQLDGEDWLMDALIGRFSVENTTEAAVLVAKTINYERHPDLAGQDWQTRSLMVAGNQGSDTPIYTVDFCGEMLQDMGFQVPSEVKCPPLPSINGGLAVRMMLNQGTAMVVYRGWAYGSNGWDPPYFKVDDVGALETTDMNPIVMSFVCLTGDYTASTPCFGEVFVRQGTPEAPGKGAVAFIGNGEHWSHTRYNDAMAISIFERIADPGVTDLGSLLHAGKMRYMEYYPEELHAEDQPDPEESVEFYFHIYNLLGDPSLVFWKGLPRAVDVTHAAEVPVGSNRLNVHVATSEDDEAVVGARVGVCQDGVLIGNGVTGSDGSVDLVLSPVSDGADLDITVTGADVIPYEGTTGVGTAAVFLAVSDLELGDSGGDGNLNPGETVSATATVTNHGSSPSGTFSLEIVDITGPATMSGQTISFDSVAAGASATASGAIDFTVDADAADGEAISLVLRAVRPGLQEDFTTQVAHVSAPAWEIVSLVDAAGHAPEAGTTTDLALTLRNTGSVDATAGQVDLTAPELAGLDLGTTTAALGDCAVGETVSTDAVFDLTLGADLATATNLNFGMDVTTGAGFLTSSSCATVIGPVDVSSPVGPDGYGYYAYDSADFDYPDKRPTYFWNEISTALGGPGTQLDFPLENEVVWMIVDLPFTFRYYGQDFTQMRVSDNGWISFDTGDDYDFYNWTIPTQYGTEALVAPFWDNLTPVWTGDNPNGMDPDGIYTYHDEDLGGFVIEWSRLPHYKPEVLGFQTFQLILLDPAQHASTGGDGEMLFLYRQVQNNDDLRMYATVGIESPDGLDGLELSYSNINAAGMAPLQPGLAIRMTTDAPTRVPFTANRFTAEAVGDRVQLHWECPADRPVLGWHVDRVRGTERMRLTGDTLPAGITSFQAVGHQEGDTYLLNALHPYGVTSEPGQAMAESSLGTRLALYPAHPNPARGAANLAFSLPRETDVSLRVYDVAGRLVRTVFQGRAGAGDGVKVWDGRQDDGSPVAGGIYFYRLETGTEVLTRKLILVR